MLVVLAGLALAGEAAGAGTPTGRWNLKVEQASCLLERQLDDPPAMLMVSTLPGSDSYQIAVTAAGTGDSGKSGTVTLKFDPSTSARTGYGSLTATPTGLRFIVMQGLPPEVIDDLSTATSVTMKTSGKAGTVALTNPAKAVAALRKCNADQLIEWGAAAAQFAPGGKLPIAIKDRDDWLSDKQLMALSRLARDTSTFNESFKVGVSPAGAIDSCAALAAAVAKSAEESVCAAVLTKTLFTPARDPSGQPVRGTATFQVSVARR